MISRIKLLIKRPIDKNYYSLFLPDSKLYYKLYGTKSEYEYEYLEVLKLYKQYLKLLTKILNRVHHVDHTEKYWEILIGGWLSFFIGIVYNKILILKKTNITIQDITNQTNKPLSCYIYNFHEYQFNEGFNQYILYKSNILLKKATANNSKKVYTEKFKDEAVKSIKILKPRKRWKIKTVISGLSVNIKYLYQNYKEIEYLYKNKNIYPIKEYTVPVYFKPNSSKRKKIFSILETRTSIDFVFFNLFMEFFPIYYLEQYKWMTEYTKFRYKNISFKQIFIFADLSESLTKNFFIASQIEDFDTKLIDIQHGGGYGIRKNCLEENVEINTAHHFISWGWKRETTGKIIPGVCIKNNNLISKRKVHDNFSDIVFATTCIIRYSNKFSQDLAFSNPILYRENIAGFVKHFLKNTNFNLIWRPYTARLDIGDKHIEYIINQLPQDSLPRLTINTSGSFYDIVSDALLYITDHNSTTFLETLNANIPTIIILNKDWDEPCDSAKEQFDILKNAGILYYDRTEAIDFVKQTYPTNIIPWWNSEKIQKAVSEFVYNYARRCDSISEYYNEHFFSKEL